MAVSSSIWRFRDYYERHGWRATLRRLVLAMKRILFSSQMVLFYCDLSAEVPATADEPSFAQVEQKRTFSELSPEDLRAATSFWSRRLALKNFTERFNKGARLWLLKTEGTLAGYGWTLQGSTMEPHFFPLGRHDVHLFDFHVFPQFRGHGMNPLLVKHILNRLAAEGAQRAFIEAAEWNRAQLSSLAKTPFRRFGRARKRTFWGRSLVYWAAK